MAPVAPATATRYAARYMAAALGVTVEDSVVTKPGISWYGTGTDHYYW
ncbi:MAG: hypothetical protein IPL50_19340 [Chitinophagaceae bacterium]|nr:hypothetical protein [Chitinophagaceae bacterium]